MTEHFASHEVLSLLKVDGKGWNATLFENEMKISAAICAICNNICVDAVELGCEHNYDDICLYCTNCLQQLIMESDGKCPINKHEDPVIVSNRYIQRQIANANVFCPYSTQIQDAKIKHIAPPNKKPNKNEKQIMDTLGPGSPHDNEGKEQLPNPNIAVYQEHVYGNQQLKMRINMAPRNDSSCGCHWKGTLNDLIHKHIMGCTEQYNPALLLNIKVIHLEKETKKLNEEIVALQKDVHHHKCQSENFESQLKQKMTIVADLERKNAEFHQQIISLQDQINSEIFKNEAFQNETEMGDLSVLMEQKEYEQPLNKEYLHLTASVVCMKFPRINHITTEELIDQVKHCQLWEYHDKMVCVMEREMEKMKKGGAAKQNRKFSIKGLMSGSKSDKSKKAKSYD